MSSSGISDPQARIPVKTSKVAGRRQSRFTSLDEILSDARQLMSQPVRQLGNWSLGNALWHLARTMQMSLDGAQFRAPWIIRIVARPFKKGLLNGAMRPGFKLPADAARELIPQVEISGEEGLQILEAAVQRMHREPQRAKSPVFGSMTRAEWDQLHFRHAELH
jgi:hypothetical protein